MYTRSTTRVRTVANRRKNSRTTSPAQVREVALYTSAELDALTEQLDAIERDERFRALRAVRRARAHAFALAQALAQLSLPGLELDAAAVDHPREGGA